MVVSVAWERDERTCWETVSASARECECLDDSTGSLNALDGVENVEDNDDDDNDGYCSYGG